MMDAARWLLRLCHQVMYQGVTDETKNRLKEKGEGREVRRREVGQVIEE